MHPSHQVTASLNAKTVSIIGQPGRHADAYSGPLIAGALGVAVYQKDAIVEPNHALLVFGFAEAGRRNDLILADKRMYLI